MVDLNITLLAQIINFLILVFILMKVAYKPLLRALEERQTSIAENLAQAEREKQLAEQFRQEYREQLAQARNQAQAIVEKAAKLADQTREEILTEARSENARLLKAAQDEIAREKAQAVAELRKEVVTLAIAAATKIVDCNMNNEINNKLVSEFINKLDEGAGGLPC